MSLYPHLVDDVNSRSVNLHLEDTTMDRHINSLWEIINLNETKGTAENLDGPCGDDNSNSDGTRGDGECTKLEEKIGRPLRALAPQRTPSPRLHPLPSPASSISPISLKFQSHTFPISTLQSVPASCLSSNGAHSTHAQTPYKHAHESTLLWVTKQEKKLHGYKY